MPSRDYPPASWYDRRVTVRPSGFQGGGMYATASIRAGETVAHPRRALVLTAHPWALASYERRRYYGLLWRQ